MKRITWVDNFKFFCIIAVMAEHTAMLTGLTDALNTTFYVIGFFFASGYVYTHRDGFWAFFKRKVTQLFIPWLFFSLFIIITARIVSFGNHETSLWQAIGDNFLQIRYRGDEMWFVAALFVCYIPMYFLIKWIEKDKNKRKTRVIVSFIALLLLAILDYLLTETTVIGGKWHQYPWHLEYLFSGLFLMLNGYLFRHFYEEKFDKINTPVFTVVALLALLAITWGTQLAHHTQQGLDGVLYRFVSCTVGITAMVSLSKRIPYNRYMSFVGRNTITYYGLHGKVESLIHNLLYNYAGQTYRAICWSFTDSTGLLLGATACSYITALVVSVILIIPAWLIEKYLPFAVGKGFKKKEK